MDQHIDWASTWHEPVHRMSQHMGWAGTLNGLARGMNPNPPPLIFIFVFAREGLVFFFFPSPSPFLSNIVINKGK